MRGLQYYAEVPVCIRDNFGGGMPVASKHGGRLRTGRSARPPSGRGCLALHLDGFAAFSRGFHGGSALELVPGEFLAFHGALERLKQNDREQLPIGETLQPYLA